MLSEYLKNISKSVILIIRIKIFLGVVMKKILILITLCTILFSCGKPKYKVYTQQEKEKIAAQIMNGDESAKSLYNEISLNLRNAIDKGDNKALSELNKWEKIIQEHNYMKIDETDYSKYKVKGLDPK